MWQKQQAQISASSSKDLSITSSVFFFFFAFLLFPLPALAASVWQAATCGVKQNSQNQPKMTEFRSLTPASETHPRSGNWSRWEARVCESMFCPSVSQSAGVFLLKVCRLWNQTLLDLNRTRVSTNTTNYELLVPYSLPQMDQYVDGLLFFIFHFYFIVFIHHVPTLVIQNCVNNICISPSLSNLTGINLHLVSPGGVSEAHFAVFSTSGFPRVGTLTEY